MAAGALNTVIPSPTSTITTGWRERVTAARHSLNAYGALTPAEMAARRRARLEAILAHHYFNTRNGTYRQVAQRHGLNWGEPPTGKANVFGRLFRRENEPRPPRLPFLASMPIEDMLAQLPIVDKSLLLAGNYREQPAVALEDVAYTPASSGTTSGVRGYTALAKQGLWSFAAETIIWSLLTQGIDPVTATGYLIAHFKRDDTTDRKSSGTYAAFSSLTALAPDLLHLGSTQDSVGQHMAELSRPAAWSFASPHFYRQLAARASREQLRNLGMQAIFWGGGDQSEADYRAVMDAFGLEHSIGVYAVSEMGILATQLTDRAPYSVIADRCIVEIVDDQGRHVAPGETGTVLLTSLWHSATPLIRYKIGDTARYLGTVNQADTLWRDLGIALPAPTWDDASYMASGLVRHAQFFDQVSRAGGLIIGDGKVSYDDVAAMQKVMADLGTPAPVFQLAKRYATDGRHEVVVRFEATPDHHAAARANALQAVRVSGQLAYLFDDGELPPPVIEALTPGQLGAGQFKVPPIVDETKRQPVLQR